MTQKLNPCMDKDCGGEAVLDSDYALDRNEFWCEIKCRDCGLILSGMIYDDEECIKSTDDHTFINKMIGLWNRKA